jgi:hypothetical protein
MGNSIAGAFNFKDANDGITYGQLFANTGSPSSNGDPSMTWFSPSDSRPLNLNACAYFYSTVLRALQWVELPKNKGVNWTNRTASIIAPLTNSVSIRSYDTNDPAGILSATVPVTKTANYTITKFDSGTSFNNQGASGGITFTLPTPSAGLYCTVNEITSDAVAVQCSSGTTMRWGNVTNSSISLYGQGATYKFEAINSTNWLVSGLPMTWVQTNNQTAGVNQRINFKDSATVTWTATNTVTGSGQVDVYADAIGGGMLPDQTGNAGKLLVTDGSSAAWANTITNNTVTIFDPTPTTGFATLNLSATAGPLDINIGSEVGGSSNFAIQNNTVGGNITLSVDPGTGEQAFVINGSDLTTTLPQDLVMLPGAAIQIQHGSNQRAGNAVLVAGTLEVSNSGVTANTIVMLTRKTAGGVIGDLTYTLNAGTSFTINSANVADTSTVSYLLIEVP